MAEISLIIPAYNAENHIANCLDSLLNQINIDIEIIIVNDCSTDNTKEILNNYVERHNNIKIINTEKTSGPGIARNQGIECVTSQYIGFIDSDDWVDLNFYITLVDAIKNKNCDIAIAGIADEYNNTVSTSLRYAYNNFAVIDGKTGIKLMTKSCNLGMYITPIMNNKVYKTDFIKKYNIRCSENKSWQDDFFSFFAILRAQKICVVPNIQYHYRQHENSITHNLTTSTVKIDNCIDVLIKIKEELQAQDLYIAHEKDYNAFVERCITSLLVQLRRNSQYSLNDSLIYLFDSIYKNFNMKKIISYLDNERIYKFFNL